MEYAWWRAGGPIGGVPRIAAHAAAAAAGLQVDSGAPRRPTATATRTTVPGSHPALRRDPALGPGGPRRTGCGRSRKTNAGRTVGTDRSHHTVPERAGAQLRRPGLRRAVCAV